MPPESDKAVSFAVDARGPRPCARRADFPRLDRAATVAAMNDSSASSGPRPAGHALVEALLAQGVDTVFGVPGDTASQLCVVSRCSVCSAENRSA